LVSDIKGGTHTVGVQNWVLRIFGPLSDEVTRDCRKLYNEDLHKLYSLPSKIRMVKSWMMRWAGQVAQIGENVNAYRILVGKPEGKSPLGRSRCRCVDIKMCLKERGWGSID
jgi:hypothetical protein